MSVFLPKLTLPFLKTIIPPQAFRTATSLVGCGDVAEVKVGNVTGPETNVEVMFQKKLESKQIEKKHTD